MSCCVLWCSYAWIVRDETTTADQLMQQVMALINKVRACDMGVHEQSASFSWTMTPCVPCG